MHPCVEARNTLLTPIAGSGSEEVRNQVAGHLDSRTYRNNYQDQRITLDVASLVRGQATEDALIRKLNDVGTNADPDANVALPPEALEHIASLPDVTALQSEHRRLAEILQDKYGSITKAPTSEGLVGDYMQAKTAYRTRKEFHKTRMRSQLRQDFFSQKNAAFIEAQFGGGDAQPTTRAERKVPTLSIPERLALTNLARSGDVRDPFLQAERAAAVQAMANLCSRLELKRKPFPSKIRQCKESSPEPVLSETEAEFPRKCHRLQCLFCIGDERLHLKERTRIFSKQYTLGRHVENHIKARLRSQAEYHAHIPDVRLRVRLWIACSISRIMHKGNMVSECSLGRLAPCYVKPWSRLQTHSVPVVRTSTLSWFVSQMLKPLFFLQQYYY